MRARVVVVATSVGGLAAFASCATSTNPGVGAAGSGGSGGGMSSLFTVTSTSTSGGGGNGGAGGGFVDDGGPAPVDAGMCAAFLETFTPSCVACLGASCCSQALGCYGVSDCFGYTSCQQNCPPTVLDAGNACLSACAQNYPMAEPAFGMMSDCLHMNCAMVCPY